MLFLINDAEKVRMAILKDKGLKETIGCDWFIHSFPDTGAIYTLDQKEAIYRLLEDKWILPDNNYYNLAFIQKPSIFNMLLNFTKETLIEKSLEPVVKFEHLLRWNEITNILTEDLFTTCFLASSDVSARINRKDFAWKPFIDHDDRFLNSVFNRPLTDLHFHLDGSSLNFEISWIASMNEIKESYNNLQNSKRFSQKLHPESITSNNDTFYPSLGSMIIRACAIRLFLYRSCNDKETDKNDLIKYLVTKNEEELVHLLDNLDGNVSSEKSSGYVFSSKEPTNREENKPYTDFIDYSIKKDYVLFERNSIKYLYSVLSGERAILYH